MSITVQLLSSAESSAPKSAVSSRPGSMIACRTAQGNHIGRKALAEAAAAVHAASWLCLEFISSHAIVAPLTMDDKGDIHGDRC